MNKIDAQFGAAYNRQHVAEASVNVRVLGVLEENTNGRSAYSWVERRRDGFHLFNVEEDHCGGPYAHPVTALTHDGRDFGDEYMEITHSLTEPEFEVLVGDLDLSNVSRLILNGVLIEDPSAD